MTLRWRMAAILALVAVSVSTFAATASFLSTASSLRTSVDDTLKSRAIAVNAGTGDLGGVDADGARSDPARDAGCPPPGAFAPASAAQLVSAEGRTTLCVAGSPTLPVFKEDLSLAKGRSRLRTVQIDGSRYRLLSTPWQHGGTLQVARSLRETDALLARLRQHLVLLIALATAIAAALGWVVAAALARPITRLRDTTHRIATTLDLATPIDVKATGEVGSLATSFATMVAAVRRSQEQQRRLVADASHEMRTPLTSLHSNVELVGQIERLPVHERREVIADVLADVEELSSLLAELVDLASDLEAAEPVEIVRLGDLARAVSARTLRRAERSVNVDDTYATEVLGRPRQLERAISNLVDNAVKYSEPDTPIDIDIEETMVTVRDRGCGIPEEGVARVFDRFYRAVGVRSQPGSGLGLAIVDEIVRSHGGQVFARNRTGGGTEAGFTLDLTRRAPSTDAIDQREDQQPTSTGG